MMLKKVVLPTVLALIIFFLLQNNTQLGFNGSLYASIFIWTIFLLILEPLPGAIIGFISITICAVLGLVGNGPSENIEWALSGFSNSTVWLIFAAFMFARGYERTGLGKRIALLLIKYLGKRTLTLGYAIMLADLIIAPFMPSNTARSGGTIFPIVKNIPAMYGSTPKHNPNKIGSYLMFVGIATTCITSSMFLTALAPNLLAISLVKDVVNIDISWTDWFLMASVPMIILLLIMPILVYIFNPPELKRSDDIAVWATQMLKDMGSFSNKEKLMSLSVFLALLMWIFGGIIGIHTTTAALVIVCFIVIFKIIDKDDFFGNKQAWNVLTWFATLIALAKGLSITGFLDLVGSSLRGYLEAIDSVALIIVLMVIVFVGVHYFFASLTAHTVALLPLFLVIAKGVIPTNGVEILAMSLCMTLGIMGIITPYAAGPTPIWYGANYIKASKFWGLGFIFGFIYLAVFILFGVLPRVLAI